MDVTYVLEFWGDIYQGSIVACVWPRLLLISNSSRLGLIPRHVLGHVRTFGLPRSNYAECSPCMIMYVFHNKASANPDALLY